MTRFRLGMAKLIANGYKIISGSQFSIPPINVFSSTKTGKRFPWAYRK